MGLLGTLLHHIITMQAAALLLGTLATCQRLPDCPADAVLHRERVREPPKLPGRADQGAPGGPGVPPPARTVRQPGAHQHRGTEVISGGQSDICYKCDQNVSKVSTLLKIKYLVSKKK